MCNCTAFTLDQIASAIDGLIEAYADEMTTREATLLASLGQAISAQSEFC